MAKGYSLSIGLNQVDPAHYDGWDGRLNAPEKDASDIHRLTKNLGYSADILRGKDATRNNVINAIRNAADSLQSGDMFVLYYSGHGGKLPDLDGDEDDGVDETWCLYDGQLMDDHIRLFWSRFRSNVRILVLSDSCHSGTVVKMLVEVNRDDFTDCLPSAGIKAIPNSVALNTYNLNEADYVTYIDQVDNEKKNFKEEDIKCTVRLISGCQDNQSSYDGAFNSKFTEKLKTVWNNGKFSGNYLKFHSEIQRMLPSYQSPNHLVLGRQNLVYDMQVPFTI